MDVDEEVCVAPRPRSKAAQRKSVTKRTSDKRTFKRSSTATNGSPTARGPEPPAKRSRGRPPSTKIDDQTRSTKERWVTKRRDDVTDTSTSTTTAQSSSITIPAESPTAAPPPPAETSKASHRSPPSGIADLIPKSLKEKPLLQEIKLLARSKAVGTTKNYISALSKFATFLHPIPISSFNKIHFRDFLLHLTEEKVSYHFWTQLRPAIKWLEQILDHEKSIFTGRTGLLYAGGLNIAADNRLPTRKGDAIPTRALRNLIEQHVLPHDKSPSKIDAQVFRCIMKVGC